MKNILDASKVIADQLIKDCHNQDKLAVEQMMKYKKLLTQISKEITKTVIDTPDESGTYNIYGSNPLSENAQKLALQNIIQSSLVKLEEEPRREAPKPLMQVE